MGQETGYAPDELLIQFKRGVDQNQFIRDFELNENLPLTSFELISDVMNIYLVRFDLVNPDLETIQRRLLQYPEISIVQKNHYVTERETIPSDTLFDNQWHHKNTGQTGGIVDADIDTPEAWDISTGGLTTHGDTIVVCIIEGNGVDINHIDLKNNIWKNYAEIPNDGIDNDNNGYVDDYNGWHVINLNDIIGPGSHGTRVAGMIGAQGNNITGVSGVNWNVKMMVVQGQQTSNEASIIAAYTYPLKMRKIYNESNGQAGAFVVATNSSWGIDNGNAANSPLWCAMYDSLGYYGILNIAATTNNNVNVDVVGDLPTTCASEFLIAVTMTNNQDLRAGSGYGTVNVDIGAPGSSVQTTSVGNAYSVSSGTSFASPCAAGCVALAYSTPCAPFINFVKYDPAAATLDMRSYILESVDQNAGLLAETASGGRINIRSCMDSILAACNPSTCIAPYYLSVPAITDTAAILMWEGFSADYVVYLQEESSPLVQLDASGTSSILIDTLTPCTNYTFYVQANCGADSSIFSYPFSFKTDGCCENPDLFVSSKTNTSITLDWNNVLYATQYDLRYKKEDDITWTEYTGVNPPYIFSSLEPCSVYEFQIHTQCADSTHGYSDTYSFITLGCGTCTEKTYCNVSGSNVTSEWIQSIAVNGFSNNTGSNGGWLQSNQIITALTPGNSYNITLTPGYSGFNFTEGFSVWIDFDQSGTFDAAELLINNQTTSTSLTSVLNIPGTAPVGIVKMRIGMSSLSAPVACPVASFYGEYEDYCVYIGPQSGLEEQTEEISVYPNPAGEQIWINSTYAVQNFVLYDNAGQLVLSGNSTNSVSLVNVVPGVYFLHIQTEKGTSIHKIIRTP